MKHKGSLLITIGVLLLAAALLLFGYNLYQDYSSNKQNKLILSQIHTELKPDEIALYRQYPQIPLPTIEIDNLTYVGTIKAESIDLHTPILANYDPVTLKVTPALYSGSAYQNNMIILGHSYQSCFGKLAYMKRGDVITFEDVSGNIFIYEVIDIQIIHENNFDAILSQEEAYDLTMFTCTWSGVERVVIRGQLIEDIPSMMNQ